MEKLIKKAEVLIESLPYIREFEDEIFVIKYGGSVMEDENIRKTIIEDITLLSCVGVHPVIVHGGGPAINDLLDLVGKESKFVNGLRVTDKQTMELVEMVLSGKINNEIVALINQMGGRAVGICGKDGGLIQARKLVVDDVDLGYVGEVESINPEIIKELIEGGYIPVVSPIGVSEAGETFNINADTVAGQLAVSLSAEKFIFLTDVNGIRSDHENEKSHVSSLTIAKAREWIKNKRIRGGMVPKVEACMEAVSQGVHRTHMLNGLIPHALLLEIFTDRGIGTMIVKD